MTVQSVPFKGRFTRTVLTREIHNILHNLPHWNGRQLLHGRCQLKNWKYINETKSSFLICLQKNSRTFSQTWNCQLARWKLLNDSGSAGRISKLDFQSQWNIIQHQRFIYDGVYKYINRASIFNIWVSGAACGLMWSVLTNNLLSTHFVWAV